MNHHTSLRHLRHGLMLTVLILSIAAAGLARAGEHPHDRKGLLLGFNLGRGGGILAFERLGYELDVEFEDAQTGALRFGYAFNDHFALSLEGWGFHWEDGDESVEGGVGCLVATVWPCGGGFFFRIGAGDGTYDVTLDRPGARLEWLEREGEGGLLGVGYEWRLGRDFALGVSADAYGVSYDDLPNFQETVLGSAALSIQLNWYL
jgi:hypothetical protein